MKNCIFYDLHYKSGLQRILTFFSTYLLANTIYYQSAIEQPTLTCIINNIIILKITYDHEQQINVILMNKGYTHCEPCNNLFK